VALVEGRNGREQTSRTAGVVPRDLADAQGLLEENPDLVRELGTAEKALLEQFPK